MLLKKRFNRRILLSEKKIAQIQKKLRKKREKYFENLQTRRDKHIYWQNLTKSVLHYLSQCLKIYAGEKQRKKIM